MSYLLDALKKAEQERLAAADVDCQPVQTQVSSARLPGWLVLIVLAFLIITLVKLFSGTPQESPVVNDVNQPGSELVQEPVKNHGQGLVVENQQESIDVLVQENPFLNPEQLAIQQPKTYELGELPKEVLDLIPTISLESHIFSSAAKYRSVVINEREFNEGMYISNQVVLQEITSTGIVIKVAGRQIALAKGVSWVSAKHVK